MSFRSTSGDCGKEGMVIMINDEPRTSSEAAVASEVHIEFSEEAIEDGEKGTSFNRFFNGGLPV